MRESEEKNYIIFPSDFFPSSFLFLPFVLDWIGVKHFFLFLWAIFFSSTFVLLWRERLVGGCWRNNVWAFFHLISSHENYHHATTTTTTLLRRQIHWNFWYTLGKIFLLMLAFFYKWGKRTLARSLLIFFLFFFACLGVYV